MVVAIKEYASAEDVAATLEIERAQRTIVSSLWFSFREAWSNKYVFRNNW